jgi:ferredoxin
VEVNVDSGRCEGHACCLEQAPEVFGYDDVTNVAFVQPGADLEAHRAQVLEAARGCPELAINISGAPGQQAAS